MMTKSKQIKQAVVLAGGEGKRLRPYTRILPKPLLPVGNTPILEVLLRQLGAAGITEIILAVGYQADLIKLMVGDGSQWGLKIRYCLETRPLGTAGPLRKIKKLDPDFLVLNGDLLTDLSFKKITSTHLKEKALLTVATHRRSVKIDYGVLKSENGKISEYREKPVLRYDVSMGIYVFNRAIIKEIPAGKFDFPDLVKILIRNGKNPMVYPYRGRWYDIGRPDDWEKADRLYARSPHFFFK